ncbi:helix-turn-helix domain-containing protein [Corynebacterium sp. BF-R-2]|uniref:helix-turn-helix domain-containing protein n=1 Tax=Corynebacterium sp. BF-R-2 TaxID=2943494 RepID=UPI0035BE82D2
MRERAVTRVLAGESARSVADDVGVHLSTVYEWIKKQRYAKSRRQRDCATPDESAVSMPDLGD